MTPEELWKEAIRGSQEAWRKLYEIFGGKLFHFFLKNTSDPELAMDQTQEVFEKLYRNKEAFVDGSLKTWMFRIARNLLIDHWRKKGKKVEVLGENPPDIPDERTDVEAGVVNNLHHQEMVRLIDEALPQLKEEDRLLIGLVYLGGLSIPELGKIMEIPLGTAKTKVRQARLKLDRLLAEKMKNQNEAKAQ